MIGKIITIYMLHLTFAKRFISYILLNLTKTFETFGWEIWFNISHINNNVILYLNIVQQNIFNFLP